MRIDRVEATAFGPFKDEVLELSPGMTVVHGMNETGKSSWHAALYAGLCSMRRGPGLRKADRHFTERHRPWGGTAWEVATRVTLDDSRTIELSQELDDQVECWARDVTTNEDLSSTIMYGGAPDGAGFLGLNRDTFLSTVCVRQTETLAVLHNAEDLQMQLQRAAATSGRDSTAEGAIQRLDRFRKGQVGTDRRNSTKPLRRAMDRKAAAEQQLETATTAHAEYLELVQQRDRAVDEAQELDEQLHALRAAEQHREVHALEARVARLRAMAEEFPEGEPPAAPKGEETAAVVVDAIAAFRNRPPEPPEPDGPTVQELGEELVSLPDHPDGDLESHRSVVEAERAWQQARQRLADHEDYRPSTPTTDRIPEISPSELRQLAGDLEVSVPEVDPDLEQEVASLREQTATRPPPAVMAIGAAVAVGGLGLLAAGQTVVAAALLGIGAAVLVVALVRSRGTRPDVSRLPELQMRLAYQQEARAQASRRRDAATSRCAEFGLTPDPAELRRSAHEAEDLLGAEQRTREWDQRQQQLSGELEDRQGELREALTDRAVTGAAASDGDLEDLLERYRADCHDRREQADEARRRPILLSRLETRQEQEAAAARDHERRRIAEGALRSAAEAVGLRADHPDATALLAELEQWHAAHNEQRKRLQQARVRWAQYEEALGGSSLAELEDELERRREEVSDLPEPETDLHDVGPRIETLDEAAAAQWEEAYDLRGQVGERERTLPSVAEAEEELELTLAELGRVRRLQNTLERTIQFLDAARERVQHHIAPVLSTAVTERLPLVTDGRYEKATVDPDTLRIKVVSRDGEDRDAPLLSHGTAEQIYLLLRLAMAEHLVTTDETAPLILDDALVQTDSTRAAALLDLLHELSTERQIIVFSQEDDVLTWAQSSLQEPDDRLVRLTTLP